MTTNTQAFPDFLEVLFCRGVCFLIDAHFSDLVDISLRTSRFFSTRSFTKERSLESTNQQIESDVMSPLLHIDFIWFSV